MAEAIVGDAGRTKPALRSAPGAFIDPTTNAPAFGAYAGRLPRVELGNAGLVHRALHRKRWVYLALTTEETFLALAVVHTGFAATAFAFVFDRTKGTMLVDKTALGPAPCASVTDDPHANGPVARFWNGGTRITITRLGRELVVEARMGKVSIDAVIDDDGAPPPITAIASLGDGLFSATEKTALLGVRGRARVGHRTLSLEGGLAGWDYTQGLLPRRTRWHWGFALGRTTDGEPIAFNLVEGFVGQPECAAFFGGKTFPLVSPKFAFDAERPLEPWHLTGEGIDLSFRPRAMHAQHMQLVVVRSHFVQPVGAFRGSLDLDGRSVRLENVAGVVEDQDVLW